MLTCINIKSLFFYELYSQTASIFTRYKDVESPSDELP
jgi:hypothetical protein